MTNPKTYQCALSATKVGLAVECRICGMRKAPVGRSVADAMANSLCNYECPGNNQEPRSGSLWPGESEADFGYPVGTVGTEEQQPAYEEPKDPAPPCDCVKMSDGFWVDHCYCQNSGDLRQAAAWCSEMNERKTRKDQGLIASEADFLNTRLRMYYGDNFQVMPDDDWREAIEQLIYGVLHQNKYASKRILEALKASNDAVSQLADCWHCQGKVNFSKLMGDNCEAIEMFDDKPVGAEE